MGKHKYIETPEKEYRVLENLSILNTKTNNILKPWLNTNGYLYVDVSVNGKIKKIAIHKLIAEAFIPNPECKTQINHKDGNKLNNLVSNLEWCSPKENIQHAYRLKLVIKSEKQKEIAKQLGIKSRKKIINTATKVIYKSVKEAATNYKMSRGYLSSMLSGIKPNTTNLDYYHGKA
jgi:hypothetical protein